MGREVSQDPHIRETWTHVVVSKELCPDIKICRAWCVEHSIGRWAHIDIWYWNYCGTDKQMANTYDGPDFWFKDSRDAMYFKLKWA